MAQARRITYGPGVTGAQTLKVQLCDPSTGFFWNTSTLAFESQKLTFTCTSANATIGATYTNNSVTLTVVATIAAQTTVLMTANANPLTSGTLTKASGTGDATITYSAVSISYYGIATTQIANGKFIWTMPAAPANTAGVPYFADVTLTAGASLVIGDSPNVIWTDVLPDWTGTVFITPGNAVLATTPPTAAQIATTIFQDTTAGDFTVSGSFGKGIFTSGAVPGAAGGLQIAGSNAATTYATLTSTGAFTINGVSDVAQTGDNFALIGTAGAGLTSRASQSSVTTLQTTVNNIATGTTVVRADDRNGNAIAPASTALSTAVWTGPPTGFLAATFPATIASTTNITSASGITVSGTTQTFDALQTALNSTHGDGSWATATGFSTLTAAQVATGVWQDTTSGDFTTANSIGKSLYTGVAPGNQFGGIVTNNSPFLPSAIVTSGSVTFSNGITANITGNLSGTIGGIAGTTQTLDALQTAQNTAHGAGSWATATGFSTLTAAQVATGVWQDSTAGDFTAAGSIGKSLAPVVLGTIPGAAGGFLIAGSNAATTFATLTSTGVFTVNGVSAVSQTGDSYAYLTTNLGAIGTIGSTSYVIAHQLAGAWTTTSSSVFSAAALANTPTSGGGSTTVNMVNESITFGNS